MVIPKHDPAEQAEDHPEPIQIGDAARKLRPLLDHPEPIRPDPATVEELPSAEAPAVAASFWQVQQKLMQQSEKVRPAMAGVLYRVLIRRSNAKHLGVWVSTRRMAEDCGTRSKHTVTRSLKRLEAQGLISRIGVLPSRGGRKSVVWHVRGLAAWYSAHDVQRPVSLKRAAKFRTIQDAKQGKLRLL